MTDPVEVLVWGGGTGGIAAALQAARSGATTLLLTPGSWVGGMVSAAGVCAPDGNELSPWQTGLWGALLRELARSEPLGLDQNWVSCFGYRPATAEAILRRWLRAEARLQWWPGCRVLEVRRAGDRIVSIRIEQPQGSGGGQPSVQEIGAQVFIDGSDRGELIAVADAPFRFGWEPQEQWHEPSAPEQARLDSEAFFKEQPIQSPTWVWLGQLRNDAPPAAPLEPAVPQGPFEGSCTAFGLERTLSYGRLPGGLVMLNWPLHGNDWHGSLEGAFASGAPAAAFPADAAEAELAAQMRAHSGSFAQALAVASGGGLKAATVFPDALAAAAGDLEGDQSLALMPYWREGRRLVGLEVVLEQQLLPLGPGACRAPLPLLAGGSCSAIAVGNYANDHHYPGPDWPLAPKSCRWGGRWSGTPFTIPYGALVSASVSNLLAADKAISVSHMANGATRLQPLVLNVGQAAGLAAALAVRRGQPPAAVPVSAIQRDLIEDPQAPAGPFPLWDTPWHHPEWAQRQRQVLTDPAALSPEGWLRGSDGAGPASVAPSEPGECLWQGELRPDGQGGFSLVMADGMPACQGSQVWPLITLEPALHAWLLAQERPRNVALIGCANPWGPWLRVSRLAGP
ncbi:MAG: FAD-dependent oxidoreductase [Cyanobacteriota bacterium]